MEGLLAILIAAISLALFLQKNTPAPTKKSNFMDWDTWARENDWSFFPPNENATMTIIGMRNKYSIYLYARKYENMIEDYRDETEIKIPLKFTIADGLLIQPWEGISNTPKNNLAKSMQFKRGTMDDSLCLETKDVVTTNWVIAQNEYRDIFSQLIDQHPLNRIEQRTVVLREESLNIEQLDGLISKALSMAEALDTITVAAWKKHAEQLNLEFRSKNKGGHPSLKGTYNEIEIKIVVQDNYNPYTEMHFTLPARFPKDVRLAGKGVLFNTEQLREGFEETVLYHSGKTSSFKDFQYNAIVAAALIPIFTEFPKSHLKERNLIIMCPGKRNDDLDKWLNKCIALTEALLSVCPNKVDL